MKDNAEMAALVEPQQQEMTMRAPFDTLKLVRGFERLRGAWKPWDVARINVAIEALRKSPLPAAYVDGLQDELFQMVGMEVPAESTVKVYLAFFGVGDRASHLKIGVAKNVRNRLSAYVTGNPLASVATFQATIGGRSRAMNVESALLKHMESDKAKGEWINVALSRDALPFLVESLAEVASEANGRGVVFERLV